MAWPGKQGLATVIFGQFFFAEPLFTAVGFAGQDQHLTIIAEASQDGRAAVVED
ncbi:hypothetical protein D3C86_2208340 [compost metagenome]